MDTTQSTEGERIAQSLAAAWQTIEQRLNGGLNSIKGISYSEYRLLREIRSGPEDGSSRADLARRVGLTASAVTRALRPLEKLGMVQTAKHPRDARLAVATLTAEGEELVSDAGGVVRDSMADVLLRTPGVADRSDELLSLLADLARA